jgi:hypothetical protein
MVFNMKYGIALNIWGSLLLFGLVISEVAVWLRMVTNVNQQRESSEQVSKMSYTMTTLRSVLRSHRVLYPESHWPSIYFFSVFGLICCFVVFSILLTMAP